MKQLLVMKFRQLYCKYYWNYIIFTNCNQNCGVAGLEISTSPWTVSRSRKVWTALCVGLLFFLVHHSPQVYWKDIFRSSKLFPLQDMLFRWIQLWIPELFPWNSSLWWGEGHSNFLRKCFLFLSLKTNSELYIPCMMKTIPQHHITKLWLHQPP